ncbi:RNA-directed DNA polymerase, eukaryota [Tanacetum coccineum]
MESLHLSVSRTVEAGIFTGIKIDSALSISHLFYADDAVFIGEWTDSNLRSIIQMLHCFSLASGLKINLQKSNLLGVGVTGSLVNEAAASIGCSVMKAPFKYLGVMVGAMHGSSFQISLILSIVRDRLSILSKFRLKNSRYRLLSHVYDLENNKECSVSVKCKGEIDSSFRRHVSGGVKLTHENIQDLVRSKVLSNEMDRKVLDLNGGGDFCVKDAS